MGNLPGGAQLIDQRVVQTIQEESGQHWFFILWINVLQSRTTKKTYGNKPQPGVFAVITIFTLCF